MANHKNVILSIATDEELLAWKDDARRENYAHHIDRLRECLRKLGKRDSHGANFARATLTAELERVEAILERVPSIEVERQALADALEAQRKHAAEPMPTDVDGELIRLATKNVLARKYLHARNAFVCAAERAQLPCLTDLSAAWAKACTDLAEVVAKAPELEQKYWGIGYTNRGLDLAEQTGRGYTDANGDLGAALYAVAACDRDGSEAARALLDVCWFFLARKAGIKGAALPDLSKWERAA